MELDEKVSFLRERIVTNLKCIAEEIGSKRKLSKMTGITEQQFQRYTNQGGDIKLLLALKICDATGLEIAWLATGQGEKHSNSDIAESTEKPMGTTPATEGTTLDGISVRIIGAVSKSGSLGFDGVAERVGISAVQLKRYTKQDMDIKLITLLLIAEVSGLSFKWLVTGKGNPHTPKPKATQEAAPKPRDKAVLVSLADRISNAEDVWGKAVEATESNLPAAIGESIKGLILDHEMGVVEVAKLLMSINSTMVPK